MPCRDLPTAERNHEEEGTYEENDRSRCGGCVHGVRRECGCGVERDGRVGLQRVPGRVG